MMDRRHGALVAALAAAMLMPAASPGLARSGVVATAPAAAAAHPHFRPLAGHALRRHARSFNGAFWPGGYFYDPTGNVVEAPQPALHAAPTDVRYTYSYDVPWDWAHRYPPAVAPSDRPYVASCGPEVVAVPGRHGGEHTVNIFRCY